MEKNAAAGRTPSSLPLSTPPPLALNVSSPKFAPLSPVHTKSINPKPENITSNLSAPFPEDEGLSAGTASYRGPNLADRTQIGDDRSDRYPSGDHLTLLLHIRIGLYLNSLYLICCFWIHLQLPG